MENRATQVLGRRTTAIGSPPTDYDGETRPARLRALGALVPWVADTEGDGLLRLHVTEDEKKVIRHALERARG
jgi:hypothetical protein